VTFAFSITIHENQSVTTLPHISTAPKTHFPSLGALRFFAASSIMMLHVPSFTTFFQSPVRSLPYEPFFITGDGVTLFFVLSGFLVTLSLMRAQAKPSGVDLRRYYLRRFLRIFPQIFVVTLISLLVFPLDITGVNVLLTVISGANFARAFLPTTPIGHFWSVSVEEQTFWILPQIMRRIPNLLKLMIGLLALRAVVVIIAATQPVESPIWRLLSYYQFEGIAFGGIGAYLYYHQQRVVAWVYRMDKPILLLMLLIIIFNSSKQFEPYVIAYFLYKCVMSAIFAVFILNITTNPDTILRLENRFWNTLGNLSYGMFAYHILVIYVVLQIYNPGDLATNLGSSLIFHLLVISLVTIVAWIAYYVVEKPFMRLSERLTSQTTSQPKAIAATEGVSTVPETSSL
jgi:peptidoglycan/LPS O-acetylase OafA/YrhL